MNVPEQKRRQLRKQRYERDIERYGQAVLNSAEMQEAFEQTHHTWSTVGEHTIRVAVLSLAICYALGKIHVHTDIPAVVNGSLCHDLGILGRESKFRSRKECAREHPAESVEIAKKLVKDLPEKSTDIIERHMWPGGHSKAPNSLEGVIVSAADKVAAVEDILQGSEIRHTGVRRALKKVFAGNHAHS